MVYQWEIASKWLLSPQVETLEKLTGKDGQKKDGKNGHAARTLELWFFCEFRYVHFSIHVLHELTNFFRKLFHDDESDVEEVKRKLLVCWLSGFKFFLTCTTRNKRRCCHDLVIWDISCLSGSTDVPSLKRFHTISRMVSRVAADAVAGVASIVHPKFPLKTALKWQGMHHPLAGGWWHCGFCLVIGIFQCCAWLACDDGGTPMWSQYFHFAEVVQGCFQRQALKGNSWWDVHRHWEKFS